MRQTALVVGVLLGLISYASAQDTPLTVISNLRGRTNSNGELLTDCRTGCSAADTDTDDGSIAGTQAVSLSAALANVWSGAAWVRLTQGQALMAASIPVTFASDQSALAVTGTFWQATQPISGTVTVGTFPDNEPINIAQVGGSAVVTGTGAAGAGVPRVTVSLDARTYNSPTAVSVDGASEQVLASNANRTGVIATNTSSDTISCAVAATAVANSGIVLPPYAVWMMLRESLATGAINCISSGSASNLAVQELQ